MTSHNQPSLKIAVVGDVHDQWEREDAIALQSLGVDLVLFVGDFGNESVGVVEQVAAVDLPKAVILGNHDAWYSASAWGRKKCPYNRQQENWLHDQLKVLGDTHVGYGYLDFPDLQLSVVGARPFSWGGSAWKNQDFYRDWYGVHSFEESVERIVTAAEAAEYDRILFLGHNGPTGLGEEAESPCGRDWHPVGGDHGDPDFEAAIAQVQALGKQIPLVTFGHMHHRLRHTTKRLRTIVTTSSEGTVYLNSASVPRIVQTETNRLRNFSLVSLEEDGVESISLVWVGSDYSIVLEEFLYRRPQAVGRQFVSRQSP